VAIGSFESNGEYGLIMPDGTTMIFNATHGNQYLRKDGKWATIASTGPADGDKGDITISGSGSVYTIDNGVVSTAKMGGDVTTAGKALLDDADAAAQRTTLGLGSASLSNTGDFAAASHNHAASEITSGTIATARLGSGSASALTVLKGDQSWGYAPPELWKRLNADASGVNDTNDQPWFPTAGGVSLEANSLYRFEGELYMVNGTTSHAIGVGFGGTVGVAAINYRTIGHKGAMDSSQTTSNHAARTTTTHLAATAANTTAGSCIQVVGVIKTSTAGTLIPRFYQTAASGSVTVKAGTMFALTKLGADTDGSRGTWS